MAILGASDVADYFLAMQNALGTSGPINNMKMQKLCYYAQGFALAKLQQPLFFDHIEAWQHGPVVPSLWNKYKDFGYKPLPAPDRTIDHKGFSWEIRGLLHEVAHSYEHLSDWELRNKTHMESPWLDTPDGAAITHQRMRNFFGALVEENAQSRQRDARGTIGQELVAQMMNDPVFMEMTRQGLEDLDAGRYYTLEEVRRELDDI